MADRVHNLAETKGNPVGIYLNSLSEGSRRTMLQALDSVATLLSDCDTQVSAEWFTWKSVTPEQARALRSMLAERFAASTANKMLSAFRGVMRACRDLGLIDERQYQQVARLEVVRDYREKPSRTLSTAELKKLFSGCAREKTASGRRDAAMLALFLITGVRRTEAAEINVEDYDRKRGQLHIRSEFAERVRDVKLGPGAKAAMHDWLDVRGDEPGPLLLPVDRGGTIRFRRLTDQAIYLIMERLAKRAKLPGVTTRDLRRTFVVRMIAAGLELEDVRAAVGHLSWLTTAAYQTFAKDLKHRGKLDLDPPYVAPTEQKGAKR